MIAASPARPSPHALAFAATLSPSLNLRPSPSLSQPRRNLPPPRPRSAFITMIPLPTSLRPPAPVAPAAPLPAASFCATVSPSEPRFRLHPARDTQLLSVDARDRLFPSAKVFCNPQLLRFLQNSPFRPFDDSKTLVDMELAHDPSHVLRRFHALAPHSAVSEHQYRQFLQWAFKQPQDKLVGAFTPPDYTDQPPAFVLRTAARPDPHLLEFTMDLKKRWRVLARSFDPDISLQRHKSVSSLIPLPHPFFVPGGRFQECYYWDTLWIVKGLLACDMLHSAKNAVRNLFHLVHQFGFVPNGNRVYYLNRSQPPVLALAVAAICDALPDARRKTRWLAEAVPFLDTELASFERAHAVSRVHPDSSIASHRLCVYNVLTDCPRPESFKEDSDAVDAALAQSPHLRGDRDAEVEVLRHLAAGAESGWDYSSRWLCNDGSCVSDIKTVNIVPCCLNSILYLAETQMAKFHEHLYAHYDANCDENEPASSAQDKARFHSDQRTQYEQYAKDRRNAISSVLFDHDKLFGFDYDVSEGKNTAISSVAGMMPLWCGCFDDECNGALDLKSFVYGVMNDSGLVCNGGMACTSKVTDEQWDFPNCWPPLVDIAVDVLQKVGELDPESGGQQAAEEIARRFVNSAYQGWKKDNVFHEKYDCRWETGRRGERGEYKPQTGFGWTNGTILWLLKKYPHILSP